MAACLMYNEYHYGCRVFNQAILIMWHPSCFGAFIPSSKEHAECSPCMTSMVEVAQFFNVIHLRKVEFTSSVDCKNVMRGVNVEWFKIVVGSAVCGLSIWVLFGIGLQWM